MRHKANGNGHTSGHSLGMSPNDKVLSGGFVVRKGRFTKIGPDATTVLNIPTAELIKAWHFWERTRVFFQRGGKTKILNRGQKRRRGAAASRAGKAAHAGAAARH